MSELEDNTLQTNEFCLKTDKLNQKKSLIKYSLCLNIFINKFALIKQFITISFRFINDFSTNSFKKHNKILVNIHSEKIGLNLE